MILPDGARAVKDGLCSAVVMTWVLIVGGVLVGLIVIMSAVGAFLPRFHVARRQARIGRPPETLWRDLIDVAAYPSWRTDTKAIELLPPVDGRTAWREVGKHGKIAMQVVDEAAPGRLVVKIADPALPFGGTWTYELVPDAGGCVVTITENGEVKNVMFRFMSRFVFGYTSTIDEYLRALAAKYRAV